MYPGFPHSLRPPLQVNENPTAYIVCSCYQHLADHGHGYESIRDASPGNSDSRGCRCE